jgi:hypothetical protein
VEGVHALTAAAWIEAHAINGIKRWTRSRAGMDISSAIPQKTNTSCKAAFGSHIHISFKTTVKM